MKYQVAQLSKGSFDVLKVRAITNFCPVDVTVILGGEVQRGPHMKMHKDSWQHLEVGRALSSPTA